MAISLFLHVLLLIGAYYLPLRQALVTSSSGYSIVFNTDLAYQPSVVQTDQPLLLKQPNDKLEKHLPEESKQPGKEMPPSAPATQPVEKEVENANPTIQNGQGSEEAIRASKQSEAATTDHKVEQASKAIDERGLYTTDQGKQAGALLEFVGWVWDALPQPQDDTDEGGKIVFEIKVDELGEVIAIKTLEKTVSPLVEKIYQEALIKLTFSKTSNDRVYAPTSTGRVTFIIQTK